MFYDTLIGKGFSEIIPIVISIHNLHQDASLVIIYNDFVSPDTILGCSH